LAAFGHGYRVFALMSQLKLPALFIALIAILDAPIGVETSKGEVVRYQSARDDSAAISDVNAAPGAADGLSWQRHDDRAAKAFLIYFSRIAARGRLSRRHVMATTFTPLAAGAHLQVLGFISVMR